MNLGRRLRTLERRRAEEDDAVFISTMGAPRWTEEEMQRARRFYPGRKLYLKEPSSFPFALDLTVDPSATRPSPAKDDPSPASSRATTLRKKKGNRK